LLVLFPFYNPWGSSDPHQIDNQGWGFPKISTLESIYRDYGFYVLISPLCFLSVLSAGWAAAAACSTEVPSWAAMAPRKAKEPRAC